MSSAEYSLRMYYREPLGDRTLLLLLAQLVCMTFNIHRPKDAAPMTIEDYLPKRAAERAEEKPATGADFQAFLNELGERP